MIADQKIPNLNFPGPPLDFSPLDFSPRESALIRGVNPGDSPWLNPRKDGMHRHPILPKAGKLWSLGVGARKRLKPESSDRVE